MLSYSFQRTLDLIYGSCISRMVIRLMGREMNNSQFYGNIVFIDTFFFFLFFFSFFFRASSWKRATERTDVELLYHRRKRFMERMVDCEWNQWNVSSSETLSCDHTKVTPYYIESVTTKVGFWAAPCGNLFSYLIGWCKPKLDEYILMGEDAPHT